MDNNYQICCPRFGFFITLVAMVTLWSIVYQFHYLDSLQQSSDIQPDVPSPYMVRPHLPPDTNLSHRFIVYRCQKGLCGGLADRQKGIVTSYIISQMLRRKFGIIMTKGCNVADFLIPNQVDWIVRHDSIRGLKNQTVRVVDLTVSKFFQCNCSLESRFSEDVIYYEGNINYVERLTQDPLFANIKWARNKTHAEIFQIAFSQLFRFSKRTAERYEQFRAKTENKTLLCAHFRMGRSINNPHDTRPPERSPNVEKVLKHLKAKITRQTRVFVATDSIETRDKMMRTFPNQYVEMPGTILHVDRSGRQFDCSGMEKAILDQYILSKCDVLFTSNSGFSKLAAMLRGNVSEIYQAGPNQVIALKSV